VQYAFALAQEPGAQLTVLHVVEEVRAYTDQQLEHVRKVNIERMKKFMPVESEK